MLNTSAPRRIVVLLLLAILAVPLIATAGPDRERPRQEGVSLASDFLGRFWNLLQSAWSETGCRIDPNGGCAPGTNQEPQPGSETDEGHVVDPNG